jgi:FkbM family methyltransferase
VLIIATRRKIALASLLSKAVVRARRGLGLGSLAQFRRRGITWELDLEEGIDFAIYLFGAFEPETVRAYRRLITPGAVVVDVGANVGAHALPLAQAVGPTGQVLAFEPTGFAFGKLRRNLELNPALARRVQAVQGFLGPAKGAGAVPPLYSSWPLKTGDDLNDRHGGRRMDAGGASRLSLDAAVGDAPVQLIKLDVDGHECGVLRGAGELLRKRGPIIVLELAPSELAEAGSSVAELMAILKQAGYHLTDLGSRHKISMDSAALERELPPGRSRNVLALRAP